MFNMSEQEFNAKLEKIKKENESKKRKYLLKAEKNKFKNLKSKMKTSNRMLVASVMAVILFSIVCLYIQYTTSIEVSSTLITLWYSFWTVEIVSLAGIKVSKVFKQNNSIVDSEAEIPYEEFVDESEIDT